MLLHIAYNNMLIFRKCTSLILNIFFFRYMHSKKTDEDVRFKESLQLIYADFEDNIYVSF